MKRYSLTEIILKSQILTTDAVLGRLTLKDARYYVRNIKRITRAAVNEILRMEAEEEAEREAR